MTRLEKALVGLAMGASVFGLSAVSASAAIVCNGSVCWHVHETYEYPPSAHVIVHPDDWTGGPSITFHEHDGRGYWNGSRWNAW